MKKTAVALILILVFSFSLGLGVQFVKSSSKTITVPDDYSGIQDAVDHASAGDTVFVRSGNYNLFGLVEGLTINKSISLMGENKRNTILIQLARALTIYATDEAGRTRASETVFFRVEVPETSIAPFAATLVVLVAVIAALLLHRRKRSREANPK